jgi:cytochrome c5
MFRANGFLLGASLLLLVACSQGEGEVTPVAESDSVQSKSWREEQLLAGQETYDAACASCHDNGQDGAPAIGDRDAWSDRSGLWVAVLSEHANAGFLGMPEKGGHGELNEEMVTAAVEYMLNVTFPEKPRD